MPTAAAAAAAVALDGVRIEFGPAVAAAAATAAAEYEVDCCAVGMHVVDGGLSAVGGRGFVDILTDGGSGGGAGAVGLTIAGLVGSADSVRSSSMVMVDVIGGCGCDV